MEGQELWWMEEAWNPESSLRFYDWWKGRMGQSNHSFVTWLEPLRFDLNEVTKNPPSRFWLKMRPSAEVVAMSCQKYPVGDLARLPVDDTAPEGSSVYDTWVWTRDSIHAVERSEVGVSYELLWLSEMIVSTAPWTAEEAEQVLVRLTEEHFELYKSDKPLPGLSPRDDFLQALSYGGGNLAQSFEAFLMNPYVPSLHPLPGEDESLWEFLLRETPKRGAESPFPLRLFGLRPTKALSRNPAASKADIEGLLQTMEAAAHPRDKTSVNQQLNLIRGSDGDNHWLAGGWNNSEGLFDTADYSEDELRAAVLDKAPLPQKGRPYDLDADTGSGSLAEAAWELLRNPGREELTKELIKTLLSHPPRRTALTFLFPAVPAVIKEMSEELLGGDSDNVPVEWILEALT